MTWKATMRSNTITLDRFSADIGSDVWAEIGEAARSIIHQETQAGKDWNGKRFRPYSKLYKNTRKAGGYPIKPDLTVSGNMLNSMAVVAQTASSVTLGFLNRPPTGRTLLEKAWPRLSPSDRTAYMLLAIRSKRRAGKRKGVAGRRNPSARKGKRRGKAPRSDHPRLLPSEKMQATNRLRPWFGFGNGNSKRRSMIQAEGVQIYLEGLSKH